LARAPEVPNAVGHREAAYSLFCTSILVPGQEEVIRAAQARLVEGMRSWSTGGALLNFMVSSYTSAEQVRAAFDPGAYARLAELKARYDPHNLFRINHNIPPATP
jgi:FAD/FMN-containing dehydrogenase